jgi:transposase InsO family protein
VHARRQPEATEEVLLELNQLSLEDAAGAIQELRSPKRFIRGNGNSLTVGVDLTALDDQRQFSLKALVDSGCTGSSIDSGFVRAKGLNAQPLPRPIPVYNADGTLNKGGSITHFVTLQMTIGKHSERITFGVTDLGKSDLFLGHEWLQYHNPSVDWQTGLLKFNRCPKRCRWSYLPLEPEDEEDPEVVEGFPSGDVDEGDRVFALDFHGYRTAGAQNMYAHTTTAQQLAEEASKQRGKVSFEDVVPPSYRDFADVFSKESFDSLPERRPWDHAIELTPGNHIVDCKVYNLSLDEQRELDVFLEDNLRSGRIRPSKSPFASAFFFVKKKDGKLRPVQDYRRLNAITLKNRYPLPLISELVNKLKGAKYFTKLDVRWGYNNVRVKEGDEWKAAFRTNRGLFEPLVMFFGLTNSPATFQTMMNEIFHDLILAGKVLIYLDDILIFTRTREEHRQIVRQVLHLLRQHKLFLKPEKCDFEKTEIEYLGLIISENRVRMDPIKVQGILDWPTPTCKQEVQSFLGFVNFYRRFIQGFGDIAKPLSILTGNVDWSWTSAQQSAFEELKSRVTCAPVLAIPTDDDPYRLEADSSGHALGAVLSQCQQGVWHPIAFLSKSLSSTERNYQIYDRELLAIMTALAEWRHLLMGARHPFEVWTDHQNLEYFRKPQKLNRRQARWVTELANYSFTLHHRPGRTHLKADILSRRAGHEKGENDNENITLLQSEHFRRLEFSLNDSPFIDRIRQRSANQDRVVQQGLAEKGEDWEEADKVVTWKGRVYVPVDRQLREDIIREHHDSRLAGHPGQYRTHELITRDYWWPRLLHDVRKYVEGCETCQRTKPRHSRPAAPLHPHEIPTRPWEIISLDLIGPLPESAGHNAILVIVDRFSKMIKVIPSQLEITSSGVARVLRDHVFRHHGLPHKVISDRGSNFVSAFMKEFYSQLGITGNPSTAYHPQTDGQTERLNQEVEHYLRVFTNYHQSDWAEWAALAEFAYNDKVQASTKHSPFYLNYGFHPWKGSSPRREGRVEAAKDFADRMKETRVEAEAALRKAAEDMKRAYDRHRNPSPNFKVGDRVWLEATHITSDRPTKKLDDKRYGPFVILSKHGESAYKLRLPTTWKTIYPIFNECVLSSYSPPKFPSQIKPSPPPPDLIEGFEEQEIEEILDSRLRRGHLEYLVHWKGFPREEREWKTARELDHAKDVVADFHRLHPAKPRPMPTMRLRFQRLENLTVPTHIPRYLFNWEDGTFERDESRRRVEDEIWFDALEEQPKSRDAIL